MTTGFCSAHLASWRLFICYWRNDWKGQRLHTDTLKRSFQDMGVGPNLTLNVLSFNALFLGLCCLAGFSGEFLRFALAAIVVPCVLCSLAFYYSKHGSSVFSVSLSDLRIWSENWISMFAVSLCGWQQTCFFYILGLAIEPLLPSVLQGAPAYELSVQEEYLRDSVVFFWCLCSLLLATLPVWVSGYNLNMRLVGRSAKTTCKQTALEIVYQTSQSSAVLMLFVPLCAVMNNFGFRFHIIHLIHAAVEILLINRTVSLKFCPLHQLAHEITPLYKMTHIEHHVCKTTHPVTSAAGLWEFFFFGGGIGFSMAMSSIPYVLFIMIYLGANMVVHTQWPSKMLAQWHTLHHTVHADIYNVNIPSQRDEALSKDFKRHKSALDKVSPFVKYHWLSDVAGFVSMIVWSAILLFFGWPFFKIVDDVQWIATV